MPHNKPTLRNDERLFAGQFLRSGNGLFHASMQEDGNFVVYRGDPFRTKAAGYEKTALWGVWPAGQAPAGGTGYHIYMQADGNLCIYRQDPHAVPWVCPETAKNRRQDGRVLHLEDDGRLDISGIWNNGAGDGHGEVVFDRVDYILDPAPKITSLGPPGASMSALGTNDTSTEQTQTLTVSYQMTKSSSWKVSTSLKLGTKTQLKCGVPALAEGKVEVSAEVTQGFEWNQTTSESETRSVSLNVRVLPGKTVVAKCTWNQSSLSIPYRAVGTMKFDGCPEPIPFHVEGVYDGVTTHDVHTYWKEVPPPAGGDAAAMAVAGDFGDDGWHRMDTIRP